MKQTYEAKPHTQIRKLSSGNLGLFNEHFIQPEFKPQEKSESPLQEKNEPRKFNPNIKK